MFLPATLFPCYFDFISLLDFGLECSFILKLFGNIPELRRGMLAVNTCKLGSVVHGGLGCLLAPAEAIIIKQIHSFFFCLFSDFKAA